MDYLGPYLLGPNDENQGIYTGDALQLLGELPENSVDAMLVDPPYCAGAISEAQRTRSRGQGLRSSTISRFGWFTGDNMGTAGLMWFLRSLALETMRVVKPTGSLLVFCDWRMLPSLEPAIESAGLRWQSLVVWDKGSMGLGQGFRHQHELIMHFTLGGPEYHNLGTSDVLPFGRVTTSERIHQTQKPTGLLAALIQVVAPFNGVVVDPMVGSGATCIACKQTRRRWLAFEIDPNVAEPARERVYYTKTPLFVPEPEQMEMELDERSKP